MKKKSKARNPIKRITKLTAKQVSKFSEYRDAFIGYGLCTKPAEREKAEVLIDVIYQSGTKPYNPPKQKIWVNSPLAGAKLASKIIEASGKKVNIDDCIRHGIGDGSYLGDLAYYKFFAIECNLESSKTVIPMAELCKYVNWWYPFDEVCILSERPNVISVNEKGELHNENGPALQYPDGYSVYALNGVQVSMETVNNKKESAIWDKLKQDFPLSLTPSSRLTNFKTSGRL